MTDLTTLGKRVKQARRELTASSGRDVSQDEIAKQMGVTYKTVSRWEGDKKEPSLATIARLARVLNANPCFLAFGEEGESGWTADFGTPAPVRRRTLDDKTRVPDDQERAKPRPKRKDASRRRGSA